MYTGIILLLLSLSGFLLYRGIKFRRFLLAFYGGVIFVGTILFFWFLDFWGEMLWFESLGFGERFWKVAFAKSGLAVAGIILSWVLILLLTFSAEKTRKDIPKWSKVIGACIGGIWGLANWNTFLLYLNQVPIVEKDPILGKSSSFYLFTLPFYDSLYGVLLILSLVALVTVIIPVYVKEKNGGLGFGGTEIPQIRNENDQDKPEKQRYSSLFMSGAFLAFVLAWGDYLNRFHIMYSSRGVVNGPGWTDVNILLPALNIVVIVTAVLGLLLAIAPIRKRILGLLANISVTSRYPRLFLMSGVGGVIVLLWIFALAIVPGLFQWLRVEPNEITMERPYIQHNINFTRRGFGLHLVEEREFPVSHTFTQQTVENNRSIFQNIRLWDRRALRAVYKQFQEIRLYYEFAGVDIDRYFIGDVYRQVMISARELELNNLPAQSQTFVNRRFKYTHGYGITLTNVSEFTPQGLPNLLIKDIPPKSDYPSLEVKRPQIYYGELTRSYAVVNTREAEFDYPSGDKNVYIHYPGKGGVVLSNIWRKFVYGWKFDGTRFFLSSYPTPESRVLFHRQIQERVKRLAPFLRFDDDPYIVLVDGKLYWIIDAYTTSYYYPYSEPFSSREFIEYREGESNVGLSNLVSTQLHGVNYLRNSVKIVVDAFDGAVDFYIFDENDPLIRTWRNVFPGLFKSRKQMPDNLVDHIRYPADMLLVQGLVYSKYHMSDPAVFYNQEDLWVRATEKYYNWVQPLEPYFVMWQLPESDQPQFVLLLPFTPKNRQVLIGWIAGMCDGENYGRFLAYKFPKEKRVLGPQQVETKIDQDRFLAGQLTLWDQRGSSVIRGNVLTIPINDTLLYVEPIYLQADTAAYPELRLVVVMHQDKLSYAENFDEALRGLFEEKDEVEYSPPSEAVSGLPSFRRLVQDANDAFENYLRFMSEKEFKKASEALGTLHKSLQQLMDEKEQ